MYHKLRAEKPFISGKAIRKSALSCSITLSPQLEMDCLRTISEPMLQYNSRSSVFTLKAALIWLCLIRCLSSISHY